MNRRANQAGLTMWGLISVSFLIVMFALLLFQLLPAYLSDLKIGSALQSIQKQAQQGGMTKAEIITALEKRFDIDSVTHINPRQDVIIQKRGNRSVISIAYERQIPLVGNISALLEFDHSVEVPAVE